MGWPGGALGLDLGGVLIGVGIAGTGLGVVMGTVLRAVAPERCSQTVGTAAAAGSLGTFLLAALGQWMRGVGVTGMGVSSLRVRLPELHSRAANRLAVHVQYPAHHVDQLAPYQEVLLRPFVVRGAGADESWRRPSEQVTMS